MKAPVPHQNPEARSLQDRAWDLWGELLLDQETQNLLKEVEQEANSTADPEREAFIKEQDKKNLMLIQRQMKKQRERGFLQTAFPRVLRAAAILLAAFTLAGGVALAASPALRVQVMKLLAIVTPTHTELKLVPDEDASFNVPEGWKGNNYLSYIPDDFALTKLVGMSSLSQAEYQNELNAWFYFAEYGNDATPNVDSEGAITSSVSISGHPGTLLLEKDSAIIYWTDGFNAFVLTSMHLNVDLLLKIAQGVRAIK